MNTPAKRALIGVGGVSAALLAGVLLLYPKARSWWSHRALAGVTTSGRQLSGGTSRETRPGQVRVRPHRDRGAKRPAAELDSEAARARQARDAKALYELGLQIEAGRGVQRDLARARQLYLEAAELGDAGAMYRLGLFSERGLAGPVDARTAADWYERAAAAGYADGFAAIARMYIEGRVVAPDLALAETYIEKGIQAGSPAAMFLKAANLLDLANNPSAAMSLLLQAADLGNADAQELLSRLYQEGKVVPKDRDKAIGWARQAAENGSVRGQVDLARLLLGGAGNGAASGELTGLIGEALDNLYLAENQDSGRAAFELATLLAGSHGAYGTIADIRDYAAAAFDLGMPQAACLLAIAYGADRNADPAIAAAWLERGAAQGDWRSAYAYRLYQQERLSIPQAIGAAARATMETSVDDYLVRKAQNTGITPPQPVSMPAPAFPAGLGAMDARGTVTVQFTVIAEGRIAGIQILGSTHPQLEAAAREAVSRWIFKPASKNGVPVPVTLKVPVIFTSIR